MKFILAFLLCLQVCLAGLAQGVLKGRVIDLKTNQPLAFVSIFVNTTTLGTQTNEKGEFTLKLKPDKYEIVVSYAGYEPVVFSVNTSLPTPSYLIKLEQKAEALMEVEVKAKRDQMWYNNLAVFKQNFLGDSRFGKNCQILNPTALIIMFDPETGVLRVNSKEDLQIINPELGYKINYVLQDFSFDTKEGILTYVGYPRFSELKGGRIRQNKWHKNRQAAYNGSVMHFVRTLRTQELEAAGFNLRRLNRYPNPDRPSEEQIKAAREVLKTRGPQVILTPGDTISEIIAKARLPKIIEKLDTTRVPYNQYLQVNGPTVKMIFSGFYQIVYTGEKEEENYVRYWAKRNPPVVTFQTSVIFLKDEFVYLEESGNITNPLGIFFEGYWGYEKIGEMLPYNYIPEK